MKKRLLFLALALLILIPITLAVCIDEDQDGYGAVSDPECAQVEIDCDDTDPLINPGVSEACQDLLDNDCDAKIDEGCGVWTCGDGTCAGAPYETETSCSADCGTGGDTGDGTGEGVSCVPLSAENIALLDFLGSPGTNIFWYPPFLDPEENILWVGRDIPQISLGVTLQLAYLMEGDCAGKQAILELYTKENELVITETTEIMQLELFQQLRVLGLT